jgi:hypothetical protein
MACVILLPVWISTPGQKEKHVSMRSEILGTTATLALASGGAAAVTAAPAAHAATFTCGNTCVALTADNIGGFKATDQRQCHRHRHALRTDRDPGHGRPDY